jgi:hypothetical protein
LATQRGGWFASISIHRNSGLSPTGCPHADAWRLHGGAISVYGKLAEDQEPGRRPRRLTDRLEANPAAAAVTSSSQVAGSGTADTKVMDAEPSPELVVRIMGAMPGSRKELPPCPPAVEQHPLLPPV